MFTAFIHGLALAPFAWLACRYTKFDPNNFKTIGRKLWSTWHILTLTSDECHSYFVVAFWTGVHVSWIKTIKGFIGSMAQSWWESITLHGNLCCPNRLDGEDCFVEITATPKRISFDQFPWPSNSLVWCFCGCNCWFCPCCLK